MSSAALQRASVPLLLLSLIDREPMHGYGITQILKDQGFVPLTGAQLYPALAKLEEQGHVEATWEPQPSGPARKVYSLTGDGRQELERLEGEWNDFQRRVHALLLARPTP